MIFIRYKSTYEVMHSNMSIFIYIVMDYIYLYFLNRIYIFIGIEKINKINLHKQI